MTMNGLKMKTALAATCAALLLGMPMQAFAGECPTDKVVADGSAQTDRPTEPKGVTDVVLSMVDLSPKGPAFEGYTLRLRKLTIEPGGIVPWHSHAERAANLMMAEGAMTEYSSTCSVPIEHKAGDTIAEFGPNLEHWWKNNSDKPAVIIAGDLLPPKMETPGQM